MTNPTSNFGWQMPEATDLVTNLPADFEVFGQAVDTDFVDLLGGTTGQVLSKTSNTDLDFTWASPTAGDITGVTAGTGISGGGTSGDVTVTNSMATAIDAKGDLIAGTGADAFSRLAVGTNGYLLTADSAEATGLKWAAPAGGGGKVLQVVFASTGTTVSSTSNSYIDTNLTATITPTSNTSKVLVLIGQQMYSDDRAYISWQLVKNGSSVFVFADVMMLFEYSNVNIIARGISNAGNYLDSPASTSALTYKTQFKRKGGSGSVVMQPGTNESYSTITLLEIGA